MWYVSSYDRDKMWPTKPEMFTTGPFTGRVCCPVLEIKKKEL